MLVQAKVTNTRWWRWQLVLWAVAYHASIGGQACCTEDKGLACEGRTHGSSVNKNRVKAMG